MINSLKVENFYGLPSINIGAEGCPPEANFSSINIITGPNSSGKTGLLKLMYALVKANYNNNANQLPIKATLSDKIAEKLMTTFMPRQNSLSDLVSKKAKRAEIEFLLTDVEKASTFEVSFSLGQDAKTKLSNFHDQSKGETLVDCIFIPSKEVLTIMNAIENSREHAFLPDFDDTYFDLVKALRVPSTQARTNEEIKSVNKNLEEMFEGVITQDTSAPVIEFVYKVNNQKFTMHQTAEGIKKIGVLTTLINNRKIKKNTIIFFDEPETALNPTAQRSLIRILNMLSKLEGVQIFLASHSYYIISQLYNIAIEEGKSMLCLALSNQDRGDEQRKVSYHDLSKGIPYIPILSEAIHLQDEETEIQLKLAQL